MLSKVIFHSPPRPGQLLIWPSLNPFRHASSGSYRDCLYLSSLFHGGKSQWWALSKGRRQSETCISRCLLGSCHLLGWVTLTSQLSSLHLCPGETVTQLIEQANQQLGLALDAYIVPSSLSVFPRCLLQISQILAWIYRYIHGMASFYFEVSSAMAVFVFIDFGNIVVMWKTTGMWTMSPPGIRALSRTRGIQPIWMLAFIRWSIL